jgi:hypothetical protein
VCTSICRLPTPTQFVYKTLGTLKGLPFLHIRCRHFLFSLFGIDRWRIPLSSTCQRSYLLFELFLSLSGALCTTGNEIPIDSHKRRNFSLCIPLIVAYLDSNPHPATFFFTSFKKMTRRSTSPCHKMGGGIVCKYIADGYIM